MSSCPGDPGLQEEGRRCLGPAGEEAQAPRGRLGGRATPTPLPGGCPLGSEGPARAQEPGPTGAAPTRACGCTQPNAAARTTDLLLPHTRFYLSPISSDPTALRCAVQTKGTPFVLLGERGKRVVPAPGTTGRPARGPGPAALGGALIVQERTRKLASLVPGCGCPVSPSVPCAARSLLGKLVAKFLSEEWALESGAQGWCERRRRGQKRSSRLLCSALGDRPGQESLGE